MKTILAAAVALVALQVPASAQAFGGANPGGAVMGMVMGALMGGNNQVRPNYGNGYNPAGYPGNGGYNGYGNGGYGNGAYGGRCRVVVRRGVDDWGNPVAMRQRICN